MDNIKKRTDYKAIIYGLLAIVLVGIVLGMLQGQIDSSTIKNLALIVAVTIALACQFYIYGKGGLIPRNGKPTIHSKIILFSIVVAVVFLTMFWIVTYFMFGRY